MADAAENISVEIIDDTDDAQVDPATGTITVPQGDGGVVVHLDARRSEVDDEDDPFYANLAEKIAPGELSKIATELHEAITADNDSRAGSLALYERVLDLLGIKLSEPKAAVGDSSAGADGLSTVTNPLMLEAVLKGWANAEAELLPASGPVKVKDDGNPNTERDALAEAYERDFNHYLTVTAPEYYPDTSHMLLWGTHLRGSGFKKVYRCPLRRRPVSESVDAKNLIVSDAMKDLRSCARITHEIPMRPSVFKRMVQAGAYRDVNLPPPMGQGTAEGVDEKVGSIQGTTKSRRPEDQPYTIWECQCELDLEDYGPSKFTKEGIPLPYIVTLDKETMDILAIRRDWEEEDEECHRQRMYVRYPYVPGPGFYGTGLLNILGNCSAAMTAAWRIALDAGMLANFPGGVISKDSARGQTSATLKGGPTEFVPVETGGKPIAQMVMAWPYKDVSAGLLTLMDKIKGQADAAGAAAEIPVGEGLQNVPVGTMLAAIEQATKVMAAAFKGMHTAQSEEIELFVELFRQHPEDFWRDCPNADEWDEQRFIQALNDHKLIPVSDPNVPSHIHRVAKAQVLIALCDSQSVGPLMNKQAALKTALRAIRCNPDEYILPPVDPAALPPDPKMIEAQAKLKTADTNQLTAQIKAKTAEQEAALEPQKLQNERDIAAAHLQAEQVIHENDAAKLAHQSQMDRAGHALDVQQADAEHARENMRLAHDITQDHHDRRMDVAQHALDVHQAMNPPAPAKPQGGKT